MLPSALTRCLLQSALLSLSGIFICSASAQNAASSVSEKADVSTDKQASNDMSNGTGQGMYGSALPNVRKLSDNDLSCEQIHAETDTLQKTGDEQRAAAEKATQAVTEATNELMQQATSARGREGGASMGMGMISSVTGVLGMIPGTGGMAASMVGRIASRVASQAADVANPSDIPESMKKMMEKMMEIQQNMANAEGEMYYTQARHDYLVELFLKKDCKLSKIKELAKE